MHAMAVTVNVRSD